MDKIIRMTLIKAGVRVDFVGYKYLCKAVELALENPDLLNRVCKGLYTQVANFFHTTYYCVEKDMRLAIEHTSLEKSFVVLNKMFRMKIFTSGDKLSTRQFIILVVEYIKLGLYKDEF